MSFGQAMGATGINGKLRILNKLECKLSCSLSRYNLVVVAADNKGRDVDFWIGMSDLDTERTLIQYCFDIDPPLLISFSEPLLLAETVHTDAVPAKIYPHRVDTGSPRLFSQDSDNPSPDRSAAAALWN